MKVIRLLLTRDIHHGPAIVNGRAIHMGEGVAPHMNVREGAESESHGAFDFPHLGAPLTSFPGLGRWRS